MNVFIRELKANRKALIIWCVCMVLLVVSGMGKYTAYTTGNNNAVFNSMPYSLKALLGFGSFDVTTISGFYAMMFLYIALAAAIHAALLGAGIIAKEERDKTTEFLMVKPLSRNSILLSKMLAALLNIFALNVVTLVTSVLMVANYNKGADISGKVAVTMLSMLIVQLIFLTLGMVLAAVIKKPAAAGSLATGILLIAFVISKITDLTDKVNALNILSPFKYFNLKNMIDGKGLNPVVLVLSLALIAVFTAITYVFYNKRDLNI